MPEILKADIVVIGSANPDIHPLVRWLQCQRKKVIIFASGIPRNLQKAADTYIEVHASLMEGHDDGSTS